MAYVPKQLPEDQENQFARTEPTTPYPTPQGGGSAGSGQAPGAGTSTEFGTNAAKLTDYLKANEAQVGEYGQEVASDLTSRYNTLVGNIDTGLNQFSQEAQGGYTPPDQTRVNAALQNPGEFVKNQQNVQDFQSWYSPQYKGPGNFEGSSIYSDLNNQVNQAVQNAGLTSSQGGLGTYMNNFMGKNLNTEGMRVLDTALLQRNPQARQAIQTAADPYKNLTGYLQDTTNKANQAVAGAKEQVASSGADIRAKTAQAGNTLSQDLQNRLAQTQQGATTQQNALRAAFEQGAQLTPTEMELLGIDPGVWSDILKERNLIKTTQAPFKDTTAKYGGNFDLLPYFIQGNPQTSYNTANVANANDYANEAALQLLSGNQINFLPDDVSQAGTAPKTLASFDANKVKQDVYNQRRGLDQSVIDQYKDMNLGAYDAAGWQNLLKDPFQANSYKSLIDIYNRNEDLTNPLQKGVANQLQQWLDQSNTLPTGGDAFTPTEPGTQNLRIVDGKFQYWNGSEWGPAPSEYIYRDSQGNQTGPTAGSQPYKFNYETGQYEPYGNPITSGTRPPGVVGF